MDFPAVSSDSSYLRYAETLVASKTCHAQGINLHATPVILVSSCVLSSILLT